MSAPKILLIHSGHSFSTSDVYDGLRWGLRSQGAEVLEYRWDISQQMLSMLVSVGQQAGVIPEAEVDRLIEGIARMAGSDALAMALHHEVDAALVVCGLLFPPDRASLFARAGIPIGCYGTEAPYMADVERGMAPAYTHWFTQERRSVGAYDVPMTYLPLAYNPETHQPGPVDPEKRVDVVFVGGGYPERKALLRGVDWAGIDRVVVGTLWGQDLDALKGVPARLSARGLSAGSIPNAETAAWHRSARISLNMHRVMTHIETQTPIPSGIAESANPRVYEVPAVGGFLLSDDSRPETAAILGDAAALYRAGDSADLERQIRYYLTHPGRREDMAAAQHAAIQPHHYGARAATVLATLL